MDLSLRLATIVKHMDSCESIADIGTDHGYIPIYAVKQGIVKNAVASDINKGPIEKAKINVSLEGLKDRIQCKLGGGLSTLVKGQVEAIVIAGMGGNLTRDILLADIEKVKLYKYLILQPAQNPEILREFLYNGNFEVIDEDICFEDDKYYELFKVRYSNTKAAMAQSEDIFYEISPIMLKKQNPITKEFILSKISKYENILQYIKDDTSSATARKAELEKKILRLKEMV